MKSFKKVKMGAAVLATAMLASSVSAFACANDKFVAYEQLPGADGLYNKLYKCPEKGAIIKKGAAEKVEWKHAFYEAEYPHREIEVLVLDDIDTGLTRFEGKYADVNTEERPEFWESKDPYVIYNRLFSDFTGTFEPTTVLKTNFKTAAVAKSWVEKGFDKYVIEEDGTVKDYSLMYAKNVDKTDMDFDVLAELEAKYWEEVDKAGDVAFKAGTADDAYAVFEHGINRVSWLELEGPDYDIGGTTKFQPFARIVEGNDPSWYDDTLVSDNYMTVNNDVMGHLNLAYDDKHADVEWVTVGYELAEPYRYYQVLSIDGVLMDGSEVEKVGKVEEVEEVVDVKKDFADKIQVVSKGLITTGYNVKNSTSYLVRPYATEVTKNVDVEEIKAVDENDVNIVDEYDIPLNEAPNNEVRFVKINEKPGTEKLPYIWRYAGGHANPQVEWKIAFAEAKKPYEIFEEKFVDGIATGIYRTTHRFADDMPSVSNTMSEYRVLTVKLTDISDPAAFEWELINGEYDFIREDEEILVVLPDDKELYPGHYDNIDDILKPYLKTTTTVEKVEDVVTNVTVEELVVSDAVDEG